MPSATPLVPLVAAVAVGALALLGGVGLAYWTFRDAAGRGSDRAVYWAAFVFALSLVGVPTYLLVRSRLGARRDDPSLAERLGGSLGLGLLLAFVAGAVLTPPDPYSQVRFVLPAAMVAVPLAYWTLYRRRE